MNDEFGRLEGVVLDISPRLVAHRRVGLPIERANVAELATLQVKHSRVLLHGVVLIIDYSNVITILKPNVPVKHTNVITILQGTVVIKRGKAREVRPDRCLADPPVEVDEIGMIFLDEFGAPSKPVVGPRRRNIGKISADGSAQLTN